MDYTVTFETTQTHVGTIPKDKIKSYITTHFPYSKCPYIVRMEDWYVKLFHSDENGGRALEKIWSNQDFYNLIVHFASVF